MDTTTLQQQEETDSAPELLPELRRLIFAQLAPWDLRAVACTCKAYAAEYGQPVDDEATDLEIGRKQLYTTFAARRRLGVRVDACQVIAGAIEAGHLAFAALVLQDSRYWLVAQTLAACSDRPDAAEFFVRAMPADARRVNAYELAAKARAGILPRDVLIELCREDERLLAAVLWATCMSHNATIEGALELAAAVGGAKAELLLFGATLRRSLLALWYLVDLDPEISRRVELAALTQDPALAWHLGFALRRRQRQRHSENKE